MPTSRKESLAGDKKNRKQRSYRDYLIASCRRDKIPLKRYANILGQRRIKDLDKLELKTDKIEINLNFTPDEEI